MSDGRGIAGLALILALVTVPACAGGDDAGRAPTEPQSEGSHRAPASPASETATLTGKERLGDKGSDEQRLDNCNVPPEKRGPRERPGACSPPPSI